MSALRDVKVVKRWWKISDHFKHEMQQITLVCGHVADRQSPPGAMVDPVAWRCLDCPGSPEEAPPPPARCPSCSFPRCGHEPCVGRTYVPGEVCPCCGTRVA